MRPALLLAAIATAVCGAVVAPAGIASAEENPIELIGRLEADGYNVNIDRVGSAPLDQCQVTSVRNPQTVTKLVRVANGKDKNGDTRWRWIEVVVSKSITVSLYCAR